MATATLAGTHAANLSSTSEREVLKEEEGESEEGETFKKAHPFKEQEQGETVGNWCWNNLFEVSQRKPAVHTMHCWLPSDSTIGSLGG